MSSPTEPPADINEVRHTAELLLSRGATQEVRVMDGKLSAWESPRPLCGFFNDVDKLVAAVAGIHSASAVYIVANSVNHGLLARADNQFVPATKGQCTGAQDISGRGWFILDIDPIRPSDTGATEAQRQAAIEKAGQIKTWLKDQGWPEPVEGDSGNGRYLLYGIDVPVEDEGLIRACLTSIAKQFDDDKVHIDPAMAKPAQMIRLFGTQNRKGENTPERPHRMSRLVHVPEVLKLVPLALLDKLAEAGRTKKAERAQAKKEKAGKKARAEEERAWAEDFAGIDLERWIAEQDVPVEGPEPWTDQEGKTGRCWVFDVCPWNPEHTNKSAYILQFDNGAIAAGCHHNGCAGKDWHALRDKYEPDWRQRRVAQRYAATPGGLVYLRHTDEGTVQVPLTNFTARIVSERILDDGAEIVRTVFIEAEIGGRTVKVKVPSEEFGTMNWITKYLGAKAVVYPGRLNKDHVRTAIQLLSDDPPLHVIYQHAGWRKIDDQWVYLHGGGAVGPVGPVPNIEINLVRQLDSMVILLPADDNDLRACVRGSLKMLDVAPDHVTLPIYLAVWRAVLGDIRYSIHVGGFTGIGKTELVALAQQHYGAQFTSSHLPTSWSSTANSIEAVLFAAKDMLVVVDDFAPSGTMQDTQRQNRDVERVFRAVGNKSGRGRARPDGTIRPDRPPRGLPLSTGEDMPRSQSVKARTLIIEMTKGDMRWEVLTEVQKLAAGGAFAKAMGGYLRWQASRYEQIVGSLADDTAAMRDELSDKDQHRRTPELSASLLMGFVHFLKFAVECGAVTQLESDQLFDRAFYALHTSATSQVAHQEVADPVPRFFELLRSAFTSGRAHVLGLDGKHPANPTAWGWRERTSGSGINLEKRMEPQGDQVGWIDDKDLYLNGDAAFKAAQSMGGAGGEGLSISMSTLWKRLQERGFLKSIDTERNRLIVRKMIQGARQSVYHLHASSLYDTAAAQPAQPAQ